MCGVCQFSAIEAALPIRQPNASWRFGRGALIGSPARGSESHGTKLKQKWNKTKILGSSIRQRSRDPEIWLARRPGGTHLIIDTRIIKQRQTYFFFQENISFECKLTIYFLVILGWIFDLMSKFAFFKKMFKINFKWIKIDLSIVGTFLHVIWFFGNF